MTSSGTPIRVLIADDNAVIRQGLASLLEAADDVEVVAQAGDGRQAVAMARQARPDVVLLDVRMPATDGVTAAAAITPEAAVLMLTYAEEPDIVAGAIRAGAGGYLVHGRFSPDELAQAVRDVAAGESVLSPAVAGAVFAAVRSGEAAPDFEVHALTEQETEVMALLATGRSNRQIAAELFISEKTVKNHLSRAYAKLGVSSRAEAMAQWLGSA